MLRELEPLRWSRLRDVAAEIKLRSRVFPIYFLNINGWILIMEYLLDYCLWNIYWITVYGSIGLLSLEWIYWNIFYELDLLEYLFGIA